MTAHRANGGWSSPFWRASAVAACSLFGGIVAAGTVLRLQIGLDPVDVVGVPLLWGYSERSEQWALFAYVLAVIVLTRPLALAAQRIPDSLLVPIGAAGLLWLCVPGWCHWPERLPLVTLVGALTFVVGSILARHHGNRAGLRQAVAWAIWGLGFPDLPLVLLSHWASALAVVLVLVTVYRLDSREPRAQARWRKAGLALMVVLGTATSWETLDVVLASIGAAGLLVGTRTNRAWGLPWLAYVGILAVFCALDCRWSYVELPRSLLLVVSGASGAFVIASAIPATLTDQLPALVPAQRWFPLLAVTATALLNISRPWFDLLITVAALGLALLRPELRWRGLWALGLAVLLLLALPPGAPSSAIDSFHDGQILSAVWEFESGRPLYSEVFPLRGYEFFEAWLARRLAAPSLGTFFIAKQVLAYLPVAGILLMTYAWTRSLAWSFVTALAATAHPALGDRAGLPLLFAALGVSVLRSRNRWRGLIALSAGSGLAAFSGFDMLIPLAGAAVLTVLVAGPPGGERAAPLPLRAAWAAFVLLATVVPFTVFVALWQGPRSAGAYWWLLLDNARNLPAFYGLPLPWRDRSLRALMMSSVVTVGVWAGVGALVWTRVPAPWRRAWLFLLIDDVLVAQRGVGRTDGAHLVALILPNLVLTSIGLFELLRFLAHQGLRMPLTDRRTVAFAGLVWFGAIAPQEIHSPASFLQWVHTFATTRDELARSPLIMERVGDREYLWEMEGGMLNYVHQRHNPTRHAIAYCISSPHEQRVAVAALRLHPPQLIAWRYLSGSNNVPNPLRHYVIAQELYRRYRPLAGTSFLEPAPAHWPGTLALEAPFLGPLPAGRLPLRWGDGRLSSLTHRVRSRETIGPWNPSVTTRHAWEVHSPIDSRTRNYLELDLVCEGPGADAPMTLDFAPAGRDYEEASRVTFTVLTDGSPHRYLLPIGCSPGWSWRPAIDRLRLSVPQGCRLDSPRCECWEVDETRFDDRP
ncbi:MAG: hypothetical protein P4L84_34470 [Isosphaeraceae bacterium]|nr:hypothetical protein [Isosphaeraceae bacterium]